MAIYRQESSAKLEHYDQRYGWLWKWLYL